MTKLILILSDLSEKRIVTFARIPIALSIQGLK
jgi:hypothetical protein